MPSNTGNAGAAAGRFSPRTWRGSARGGVRLQPLPPDYVALVCGTLEQLPAKFSALDAAQRQPMASNDATTPPGRSDTVTAALPLADRRLVRIPAFREHLAPTASRTALALADRIQPSSDAIESNGRWRCPWSSRACSWLSSRCRS